MALSDPIGALDRLTASGGTVAFWRLGRVLDAGSISRLPFVVRTFLENVLRHQGSGAERLHLDALAGWPGEEPVEFPFLPARVVLQDFTGVPVVADLAAIRGAVERLGGDVARVNPRVPVDLVIDHSVIVDFFGSRQAFERNVELEYERNRERYAFLRWAQQSFSRMRVVPPGSGIVHQVNLEFLASVVMTDHVGGETIAYPDTLVGTDSHTTMIGGLGVLGWGVGGIEAEAAMLGEPVTMLTPSVVGVRLDGSMPSGATATDLVLTLTELLRKYGVVGKFVEFYGPGLANLPVPDRATITNMSPEYGATEGFFPVDQQTLAYLRATGRSPDTIDLVERYCKEQQLWHEHESAPDFAEKLELDLSSIEPSLAGPKRPQDRVTLPAVRPTFRAALSDLRGGSDAIKTNDGVSDGSVVIAAITSCTNTSNPSVMIAAGLLARDAVERGLRVSDVVKTSLAPGSPVVEDYLRRAGLLEPLEKAGFYMVGFGCTTCIAAGTPVLHAGGIARRIEQLPVNGGTRLLGPIPGGGLGPADHSALIAQGVRDCIVLALQDGRTLSCTPDHELLRADGSWVRADELRPGRDRLVVGPEGPLDEAGADEGGYRLSTGSFVFTMDSSTERDKTLAFARLLGHLLDDGSISVTGQARIHVAQAMDRDAVLADIELVTGKRPAGTQYDERTWSIVLPKELAEAIIALPGVRRGRRIEHIPTLPEFVLDETCPRAVVREFLAGSFGADGTAPVLKQIGAQEESAILERPAYSHAVKPEHVEAQRRVMGQVIQLLSRCSVQTEGATIHTFPVRRAASSCPQAQDGEPRIEVRLQLPDGMSFVTKVGFRYSVEKWLRASAAAVYWRTIEASNRQRLWMAARLRELHAQQPELSFRAARDMAAKELESREPIVHRHYSTLAGCDRFSRLPSENGRSFRPLHRRTDGFPSPVEVLREIGARDWFAPLQPRATADSKRYLVEKEARILPHLTLQVLDIAPTEPREVFDLSVPELQAFVAGGIAVHNCIGNSGPLPDDVAHAIDAADLGVAAVLSGNRNFEGRIHPQVRFSFLASPPLVVAYALAGTVDIDLSSEPLGTANDGTPVYLRDIWPSDEEIATTVASSMDAESYRSRTQSLFAGDERWKSMPVPTGDLYEWDPASTYITEPPFVSSISMQPPDVTDIAGARCLVMVGDSVTTDHISPAGSIAKVSPAATWLGERGVAPAKLHSYGARRGHHEVMMRGTFANIRLRNLLVPGSEGGVTAHLPDGEVTSIFEASERYRSEGVPLVIIAGKEYGSGSSRDWAAKGTALLGARAVIAESYERIHRSNLAQMGLLPLEFAAGESASSLGLTGRESFDISGLSDLKPQMTLRVIARKDDGSTLAFDARCRLDTPTEVRYFRQGGILPSVVRELTSR